MNDENKLKGERKSKPNMGLTQHHLTIWVKESEWDRMKFLSASSGKTLSKYVEDICIKWIENHPNTPPEKLERSFKSEKGTIKPLSFSEANYKRIQDYVKKNEIKMTRFIVALILGNQN